VKIDTVFLEITTKCNLACIKCPNRFFLKEEDIDQDTLNFILFKVLSNYEGKIIIATGEPTLHINGLLLINKWCQLNKKRAAIIFTNGTLLHTLPKELLSNQQITFIISLDGISYETIQKFQPNLNIVFLKSQIKKLRENGLPVNLLLNFTIHKFTRNEIQTIFKFSSELNINKIFFTPLLNFNFPNKNIIKKYQLSNDELKKFSNELITFSQKYKIKVKIGFNNKCKLPRPIFHTDGTVSYCEGSDGIYKFKLEKNILNKIEKIKIPNTICKNCFKINKSFSMDLPPRFNKLQ